MSLRQTIKACQSKRTNCIKKLNVYWRILRKYAGSRFFISTQHPIAHAFISYLTYGLLIGLLIGIFLFVNSVVYVSLVNAQMTSLHALTWFNAVLAYMNHPAEYAMTLPYLLAAAFIPIFLLSLSLYSYRQWGHVGLRYLGIAGAMVVLWLTASATAFLSITKGHFQLGTPLDFIQCYLTYYQNSAICHQLFIAGGLGLIPLGVIAILLVKNKPPNIYGDAHFATFAQTRAAGLFKKEGLILGKAWGKYLCIGGYEHVTLFAPTGSGKTVGFAIPNLFFWQGSCVVNDVKLELFKLTSKYRESIGHQCYLWNPASPDGNTHCYNPLDLIQNNPHTRIDDIQKIAAILIPDNPRSEPIWQVQSRLLFVALVLYVLDTQGLEKTIGQAVRLVKESPNFGGFLLNELAERTDLDPVCRNNFYKFCELHEKTRNSILATFLAYFELFDNPLIEAATAKSDFDIRELRQKRLTIYVGITNDNLVRLSPLITVFYQQVMDVMTRQLPKKNETLGVLLLMEEFPALRRMELLLKNIGLLRQYQVRVVIIIQELSQLYETYGRDGAKVFINAKVRIAYAQNDDAVKNYLSNELGSQTIKITNTHRQSRGGLSFNNQYVKRPLLLPQEIGTLPINKALILVEGKSPIYADKLIWLKEKLFKHLNKGAVVLPNILGDIKVTQSIQGIPKLETPVELPLAEEATEDTAMSENTAEESTDVDKMF